MNAFLFANCCCCLLLLTAAQMPPSSNAEEDNVDADQLEPEAYCEGMPEFTNCLLCSWKRELLPAHMFHRPTFNRCCTDLRFMMATCKPTRRPRPSAGSRSTGGGLA